MIPHHWLDIKTPLNIMIQSNLPIKNKARDLLKRNKEKSLHSNRCKIKKYW